MSHIKSYWPLTISFVTGILILFFTVQITAGQDIKPVLKGKDALPDALKGPGIESLDAFKNKPADETITSEKEIQGRFLQALGMDDVDQALYLISKGAQVNRPLSDTGSTALMLAQSLPMVRMLVLKDADINTRDNQNGTALHYAVTRPAAIEIVPFLVRSGADLNARGWENETPFNIAVNYLNETRTKDLGILKLLAELGADINAPNNNGYTGLMQAAAIDNRKLADTLISLGADKTLKNPYGKTAREIAYESGSRYIYQQLE